MHGTSSLYQAIQQPNTCVIFYFVSRNKQIEVVILATAIELI